MFNQTNFISKVIPYMVIVVQHKDSQLGVKGQSTLVPVDLKKIQKVLPRSFREEYLISRALNYV